MRDRPVFDLKVTGADGLGPPLTWSNRGFAYSMMSSGSLQGAPTYTSFGPIWGRNAVDVLYDTVLAIDMIDAPQPIPGETRTFTVTVTMDDGRGECRHTGDLTVR